MLLGLDLGTTNVKAAVSLPNGEIIGRGTVPIQLFHVGDQGIEQDIDEIWAATVAAIRAAVRGLDASQMRAIGISSQGGAMQILDSARRPLGRVLSWLDNRGWRYDARLTRKMGKSWFGQHIGFGRSGLTIGQILRLQREIPGCLSTANYVGFVGDIIAGRLCGRAAHDGTSCGLTLLYNARQRGYDRELLRRLRLLPQQLPDIIPVRQAAGTLLPDIARKTGLRPGIPVSVAIHDQYAAALGTGVVRPGDVMFGAGTAWVLLAITNRFVKPVTEGAFVCHHVVDDYYGQILSLRTGGSAVSWIKSILGFEKSPDSVIDDKIAPVAPGCDGICFWPFVTSQGASELAPGIKGQFTGVQFFHTPGHFIRAVIEGLAYELNRHLRFVKRAHIAPSRIVMCGGAARSRITPSIIADVSGLPITCSAVNEGSLLGALILARGLVEPRSKLSELSAQMRPRTTITKPGPHTAYYQKGFRNYLKSLEPFTQRYP